MPYLNHVLDKGGLGGAGKPRGLWVKVVLGPFFEGGKGLAINCTGARKLKVGVRSADVEHAT